MSGTFLQNSLLSNTKVLRLAFFCAVICYSVGVYSFPVYPGPVKGNLSDLGYCVTCPPEWITVSCDDLDPYLNYGEPIISNECYPGSMVSGPYIIDDRQGCGSGTITKKWVIWTYQGDYTCIQHIMVTGGGGYPSINWPPDLNLWGCNAGYDPDDLSPPYNKPTWWAPECSQLMYTYRDEVYYPLDNSGICLKIFRRWKVIDWCCYNVDDPNSGCQWTHTQLIMIRDNEPPTISCPPSMTVDAGPNCTGSYVSIPPATAYDNCGNVTITNNSPYDVYGGADASGYYPPGTTHITFWAKDKCGNVAPCTMSVTVTDKKKPSPVVHHGLTTNLMCMNPTPMIELDPKWFDAGSFDNCTPKNELRFKIEPKRFTCDDRGYNDVWITVTDRAGNSETVKTYVIIADPQGCCGPDTLEPPTIVCPQDITANTEGNDCTSGYVTMTPATATSDCNGPITITNNSPYADHDGANASGKYPVGTTVVTFTAKDFCGKIAKCTAKVVVRDGKKPTPVVFHGLAVNLVDDTIHGGGTITLLPEWFDAGSFDNCTSNHDLQFEVYPNVYNCDSLGIRYITFKVTDESGNTEVVRTYVEIQDNNGTCITAFKANISGNIITENGDQISSVNLHVNSDSASLTKNVDGTYLVDSLDGNMGYVITPEKLDRNNNGVSTGDIIALKNHILGKAKIYSPYKQLAADVNHDKIINTTDLLLIRKLVLGKITSFPDMPSWIFVDKDFQFDPFTPALQQNYPEAHTIQKLKGDLDNVSFIGVKIGDLNGNVQAGATSGVIDSRGEQVTRMYAFEHQLDNGTSTVSIKPSMNSTMEGMQMAIRFNPSLYHFTGITAGKLQENSISINSDYANAGLLIISIVNESPVVVNSNDVLFQLNFATQTESKGKCLSLDSYAMQSEYYEAGDRTYQIELVNEKVNSDNGFAVFQNRPNPFQRTTEIAFSLPEKEQVELAIMDINGNVVYSATNEYPQGLNTVSLNLNLHSGIYYYTVKAGSNTDTRKMIVIE